MRVLELPRLLASWHLTVLDEPARIKNPEYLFLVAIVLASGLVLALVSWRRLMRTRELVPPRLSGRVVPGFSLTRPLARIGLSLGGLLLLSLALMQPQCGVGTEKVRRAGVDLVVVLDASRSMLARDIAPNRFERARMELAVLLEELRGDRFGLVAFAGTPIVQTPLTTDRRAASMYLRAVHPSTMPRQGTNIGSALRTAHRMLVESPGSGSQVVVLISDGEDHHGDAREMARRLADDGVVIFTVGIGTAEGELIILDENGAGHHRDQDGQPVLTRLDEELMRDIASIGGGSYVNTGGRGIGVTEVMQAVRSMEQEEREVVEIVQYADRSVWLLFPAFLLLIGGAVLRPGRHVGAGRVLALLLFAGLSFSSPSPAEARRLLEVEHPEVVEGNRAYAEGRYEEALAAYDTALTGELEPMQRAIIHYNRGTALAAAGNLEAARSAFDASIALGERQSQARDYYNLGTAMLQAGDPRGARDALVESLRRDPTNRAAQHNLEIALRALHEPPPDDSDEDEGECSEGDEAADEDGDSSEQEEDREEDRDDEGDGEEQEGDQDERDEEEERDQEDGEDDGRRDEEEDEEGDDDETSRDGEPGDDGDQDEGAEPERDEQEPDDGEEEDAPVSPDDLDPSGEEEAGASAEQVDIDEQDVDRILDALESQERPLQPFLFRPSAEIETAAPEGEDW